MTDRSKVISAKIGDDVDFEAARAEAAADLKNHDGEFVLILMAKPGETVEGEALAENEVAAKTFTAITPAYLEAWMKALASAAIMVAKFGMVTGHGQDGNGRLH